LVDLLEQLVLFEEELSLVLGHQNLLVDQLEEPKMEEESSAVEFAALVAASAGSCHPLVVGQISSLVEDLQELVSCLVRLDCPS